MRFLFLYGAPMEETLKRIMSGDLPSDRMFGLIELRKYGYDVSFIDSQPKGPFKKLINWFNRNLGTNCKELTTLFRVIKYDVIIVNDRFSTLLTLVCRLFGKKIVYIDSIFRIPRNKWNRLFHKINLELSSGTVVYSMTQLKLWSDIFNVSPTKFKALPYTIDVDFYKPKNNYGRAKKPFVLAVGRDIGRDYYTLTEAIFGLGLDLKVVSLPYPYLFDGVNTDHPWFELFEHISYEQLFQLYTQALIVVIPLKKWAGLYPSGIRALLEAMALGKCVISSQSPVLQEYADQSEGVLYVEPENVPELRQKIVELLENIELRTNLEKNVKGVVKNRFNMNVFAKEFGECLSKLYDGSKIT